MYFFYENHQNVMETVTRDRLLSSVSGLEKIEHGPDDLGPAIRLGLVLLTEHFPFHQFQSSVTVKIIS